MLREGAARRTGERSAGRVPPSMCPGAVMGACGAAACGQACVRAFERNREGRAHQVCEDGKQGKGCVSLHIASVP